MTRIEFTSNLPLGLATDLEELLFFNPRQYKVRTNVLQINERYGAPRVEVIDDRVFVALDASPQPQTLYMLAISDEQETLVGVMVYLRENDTLSLLHVAVHEDWAGMRPHHGPPVLIRMVDQLRHVGCRIRGIQSITVFPGTVAERRLSVNEGN